MSIDIIARAMAASAEGGEGTTYTAGDNIQISADNVISATDTTYEAGDNITIEGSVISATGGGTEYTAGEGIDIIDDVISISGILPAFEVEDGDITVSDEYGNHTYIYSHDIELSGGEESIELSNRAIRYTGYHDNEITVNFEVEAITTEFNIDGETKNIRLDANDFEDGDYIVGSSAIEAAFTEITEALEDKQDTLTAGTNITIVDNVISASGGGTQIYYCNNQTSYQEVSDAYDAGYILIYKDNDGNEYTLTGKVNVFGTIVFNFSYIKYNTAYSITRNPTRWSDLNHTLQDSSYMTQTITGSGSTVNYPSTQAIVNYHDTTKQNKATASTTDIGVGTTLADGEIYLVYEE